MSHSFRKFNGNGRARSNNVAAMRRISSLAAEHSAATGGAGFDWHRRKALDWLCAEISASARGGDIHHRNFRRTANAVRGCICVSGRVADGPLGTETFAAAVHRVVDGG